MLQASLKTWISMTQNCVLTCTLNLGINQPNTLRNTQTALSPAVSMYISMQFCKLLTWIQSQLRTGVWTRARGFQNVKTRCDLSSNFWTVNKASGDLKALQHHLCQNNLAPLVLHRKRVHWRERAGELLQGAGDCEARSRSRHGERVLTVARFWILVTLRQCDFGYYPVYVLV